MRALAILAIPTGAAALAFTACMAAEHVAAHDWLVAAPLLVILAVALWLIAPNPRPASGALPPVSRQAEPAAVEDARGGIPGAGR